MTNTNDAIITAPNLMSAAAQVMLQARKTIAPDYLPYLIDDAVEVTAILADNNKQDSTFTVEEGWRYEVSFLCTDTGVYSYVFSDSAKAARNENPGSILIVISHWQEHPNEWTITTY